MILHLLIRDNLAFSALRGYALSGRRYWVALLILLFFVPHMTLTCVCLRCSASSMSQSLTSKNALTDILYEAGADPGTTAIQLSTCI